MEAKLNFNVLANIEKVFNNSRDSLLIESRLNNTAKEIGDLANYLHLSNIETVIFSTSFVLSFENSNYSDVFKHFGMIDFEILKYKKEIKSLNNKNLLISKKYRGSKSFDYEVPENVADKIAYNQAFIHSKTEDFSEINLIDILEEFNNKSDDFDCEIITLGDFQHFMDEICDLHKDRPFFKEVEKYRLSTFERYFLFDTVWDAINNGDNNFNTNVQSTICDYYKQKSRSMGMMQNFVNGESKLLKLKLIEISSDHFKNNLKAKLSNFWISFLKEQEEIHIANVKTDERRILDYRKITEKPLFYNDNEQNQIENITSILERKKFADLQKKLKSKGLPTGVSIMLHGAPGTGKTESAYQIAKKTKRGIFKVDISETKSMWFGESQKLIKKIFDDYRQIQLAEKLCPILLLNEADAIIGKRKTAGSSSVADTENAIQNVLLEELENFSGILFATTNLIDNLDAAFERRFLFKIQFEKPTLKTSAEIWKSKLDFLSEEESQKLANTYHFSGGEMENIARKIMINELLSDDKVNYKLVDEICKNEKWSSTKQTNKIGF